MGYWHGPYFSEPFFYGAYWYPLEAEADTHDGAIWVYKKPRKKVRLVREIPKEDISPAEIKRDKKRVALEIKRGERVYLDKFPIEQKILLARILYAHIGNILQELDKEKARLAGIRRKQTEIKLREIAAKEKLARYFLVLLDKLLKRKDDEMLFAVLFLT